MSEHEFIFWLNGYLAGGGSDLKAIQDKLNTAKSWTEPVRDERLWFPATDQTTSPSFLPQLPLHTGTPMPPPWEVTCNDGSLIGSAGPDFQ